MNFLQLVQATKREAGISGPVPQTLANQVEEINRVAGWVNAAWLDIQTLHADWEFMRTGFSFNTVAAQQTYTPVQAGVSIGSPAQSNLSQWKRDSFRIYSTASGVLSESFLPFLDYAAFRDLYLFGAARTQTGTPAVFTIDPQKNLLLGPLPDGIYTVNGECFTLPTTLSADTDTPSMPAQFHMGVVWKAIAHYGMYEAATEAVQRGEKEYAKVLGRLQVDQASTIITGPPLA